MSRCSRTRRPLLGLMTGAALGLALLGTTATSVAGASLLVPRKAPAPSITVTPSKNLHKNEKVEVTGKNFPHKTSLVIVECNPKVLKNNSAACDSGISHLVFVTTSSKGTFPKTAFKVVTGKVGNGSCGTKANNLTCYLFVSKPTTTSTVDADAAIKFARPKS
jgi:hypothetical protein